MHREGQGGFRPIVGGEWAYTSWRGHVDVVAGPGTGLARNRFPPPRLPEAHARLLRMFPGWWGEQKERQGADDPM